MRRPALAAFEGAHRAAAQPRRLRQGLLGQPGGHPVAAEQRAEPGSLLGRHPRSSLGLAIAPRRSATTRRAPASAHQREPAGSAGTGARSAHCATDRLCRLCRLCRCAGCACSAPHDPRTLHREACVDATAMGRECPRLPPGRRLRTEVIGMSQQDRPQAEGGPSGHLPYVHGSGATEQRRLERRTAAARRRSSCPTSGRACACSIVAAGSARSRWASPRGRPGRGRGHRPPAGADRARPARWRPRRASGTSASRSGRSTRCRCPDASVRGRLRPHAAVPPARAGAGAAGDAPRARARGRGGHRRRRHGHAPPRSRTAAAHRDVPPLLEGDPAPRRRPLLRASGAAHPPRRRLLPPDRLAHVRDGRGPRDAGGDARVRRLARGPAPSARVRRVGHRARVGGRGPRSRPWRRRLLAWGERPDAYQRRWGWRRWAGWTADRRPTRERPRSAWGTPAGRCRPKPDRSPDGVTRPRPGRTPAGGPTRMRRRLRLGRRRVWGPRPPAAGGREDAGREEGHDEEGHNEGGRRGGECPGQHPPVGRRGGTPRPVRDRRRAARGLGGAAGVRAAGRGGGLRLLLHARPPGAAAGLLDDVGRAGGGHADDPAGRAGDLCALPQSGAPGADGRRRRPHLRRPGWSSASAAATCHPNSPSWGCPTRRSPSGRRRWRRRCGSSGRPGDRTAGGAAPAAPRSARATCSPRSWTPPSRPRARPTARGRPRPSGEAQAGGARPARGPRAAGRRRRRGAGSPSAA